MQDLVLDEKIRDWAVIPVALVMLLVGVWRHYLSVYLDSSASASLHDVCEGQALTRSRRLRQNADILPVSSFHRKRAFFNDKNSGLFTRAMNLKKNSSGAANPLSGMDPSSMTGMMRKHFETIAVNMGQMGWVTTFFAGMVLVKLPFGMLDRFRAMTQRGIEVQGLDGRYVSSLSWYILNTLGLRGIISLIIGDNAAPDMQMMQMQGGGMGMGGQQKADSGALAAGEKEGLNLAGVSPDVWEEVMFKVERRLISSF
uniref:ER membrane protein complex subunit 3 n=1 Tax=Paramoeba aestuarina TaxID=180227 RepID=A0A7S4UVR3_9EUKA